MPRNRQNRRSRAIPGSDSGAIGTRVHHQAGASGRPAAAWPIAFKSDWTTLLSAATSYSSPPGPAWIRSHCGSSSGGARRSRTSTAS